MFRMASSAAATSAATSDDSASASSFGVANRSKARASASVQGENIRGFP